MPLSNLSNPMQFSWLFFLDGLDQRNVKTLNKQYSALVGSKDYENHIHSKIKETYKNCYARLLRIQNPSQYPTSLIKSVSSFALTSLDNQQATIQILTSELITKKAKPKVIQSKKAKREAKRELKEETKGEIKEDTSSRHDTELTNFILPILDVLYETNKALPRGYKIQPQLEDLTLILGHRVGERGYIFRFNHFIIKNCIFLGSLINATWSKSVLEGVSFRDTINYSSARSLAQAKEIVNCTQRIKGDNYFDRYLKVLREKYARLKKLEAQHRKYSNDLEGYQEVKEEQKGEQKTTAVPVCTLTDERQHKRVVVNCLREMGETEVASNRFLTRSLSQITYEELKKQAESVVVDLVTKNAKPAHQAYQKDKAMLQNAEFATWLAKILKLIADANRELPEARKIRLVIKEVCFVLGWNFKDPRKILYFDNWIIEKCKFIGTLFECSWKGAELTQCSITNADKSLNFIEGLSFARLNQCVFLNADKVGDQEFMLFVESLFKPLQELQQKIIDLEHANALLEESLSDKAIAAMAKAAAEEEKMGEKPAKRRRCQ